MPELPEVETIVKELNLADLIGKKIVKAEVYWARSAEPSLFSSEIKGQTILSIQRRGKYIVFSLNRDTLLVHLRMTGKFFIKKGVPPTPHERIRLHLEDGRALCFEDQRKFGRFYLLEKPQEKLGQIGVEPLSPSFTRERLKELLQGRRSALKPLLLDQRLIAGLGNIYADEALWEAKLHPLTPADRLSSLEIAALHKAIQKVLRKGVENMGTTLGNAQANYYSVSGRKGRNQDQLNVFRQEGKPCPRCQTPIQKIRVAQRGTHFCPVCQKVDIFI